MTEAGRHSQSSAGRKRQATVDSREPQKFVDKLNVHLSDFTFERTILEVGDYMVNNKVVERKDPQDFYQSIIDGRLNRQLIEMSRFTSSSSRED